MKKSEFSEAVVVHGFNPSTWGEEQAEFCVVKASLVYRARCWTTKVTQNNTVWTPPPTRKKRKRRKSDFTVELITKWSSWSPYFPLYLV